MIINFLKNNFKNFLLLLESFVFFFFLKKTRHIFSQLARKIFLKGLIEWPLHTLLNFWPLWNSFSSFKLLTLSFSEMLIWKIDRNECGSCRVVTYPTHQWTLESPWRERQEEPHVTWRRVNQSTPTTTTTTTKYASPTSFLSFFPIHSYSIPLTHSGQHH